MGWLSLCPYMQHPEVGYFLVDPPGTLIIQTAGVCILEITRNVAESFRSSTCLQTSGCCWKIKVARTGRTGSTCVKHHFPHNSPQTRCVRCSFSAEQPGAGSHQVVLLPLATPGSPGCAPGPGRPAAPGRTGLPGTPLPRRWHTEPAFCRVATLPLLPLLVSGVLGKACC